MTFVCQQQKLWFMAATRTPAKDNHRYHLLLHMTWVLRHQNTPPHASVIILYRFVYPEVRLYPEVRIYPEVRLRSPWVCLLLCSNVCPDTLMDRQGKAGPLCVCLLLCSNVCPDTLMDRLGKAGPLCVCLLLCSNVCPDTLMDRLGKAGPLCVCL